MKKLLWCSFGFLMLINGVVLSHSYYNRQEIQTRVTLSERELSFPGNYGFHKENSALNLTIQWNTVPDEESDSDYFYGRDLQLSEEHYSTFGFAASCNEYNSRASEQGFVLMEFNGNAHQQIIERTQSNLDKLTRAATTASVEQNREIKAAEERLNEFETKRSRLYIIDAAASKNVLQAALEKHKKITGSQYLVLPAIIADDYRSCETKRKKTNIIYVTDLLVERISVPREYHRLFPDKNKQQQFQAVIAVGKLDEPWLESLELCEKECKAQ